ncbi:SDR family NAD(P)-dependent oxidoreductase [Modestobacter sp. I12A-02662]|uniref:SDR family NAD(P)-dependent oxidoreductase n=1 Tax=Modestobacter sp. I12A-02662 TaxID=1730496 RepID=UPI0034DED0A7
MSDLVVVTGAAGELGRALVGHYLSLGCRVAALDRTEDQAASVAGAADHQADRLRVFAADQTRPEDVDRAWTAIAGWGVPRALIANAGYAKFGGFLDMPAATFRRHVDVNLTGTFLTCQAAARLMARGRSGGSIVVVASNLAENHADQVGAYCVTKAALLPLVRTMAAELGVYRIRANALLPGVVDTAMTAPMLSAEGVRDELVGLTPAGRLGTPSDVAHAAAFLTSEEAGWITGAALTVDGGQGIYGQPRWIAQDRSVPFEPTWGPGLGADHQPT